MHRRMGGFALMAMALMATARSADGQDKIPTQPVRPDPVVKLKVPADPNGDFDANSGVTEFADEAALVKGLGQAGAKAVLEQADLTKVKVVRIGWTTGGPPFGTLVHEFTEGKDGPAVRFHVQEPDSAVRGRALRLGRDLFAVPRNAKVTFAK